MKGLRERIAAIERQIVNLSASGVEGDAPAEKAVGLTRRYVDEQGRQWVAIEGIDGFRVLLPDNGRDGPPPVYGERDGERDGGRMANAMPLPEKARPIDAPSCAAPVAQETQRQPAREPQDVASRYATSGRIDTAMSDAFEAFLSGQRSR
jgi:hypothetical protein